MKFKDRYQCPSAPDCSVGPFYNTDLRKITALANYYPIIFPDDISADPLRFLTQLVQDERSMFFTIRREKAVIGYGCAVMVDSYKNAAVDIWRRKREFSFVELGLLIKAWLDFLFDYLKLRRIFAYSPEMAPQLAWFLRKNGMRKEGVLIESTVYDRLPRNVEIHAMLRREYYALDTSSNNRRFSVSG